jgi:LEA14-like dessication related protein
MKLTTLLLGLMMVAGCANVKDPEFRKVGNFRMKGINPTHTTIGFNVVYFNPNNFGVTVKDGNVDVYMDSVYLGKFTQDSSIAVKKNADFSIPLSGAIPLKTALELDLKNIGQRDILLRADGAVRVGKAGIFVSKDVHYSGKHRLDEIQIKF